MDLLAQAQTVAEGGPAWLSQASQWGPIAGTVATVWIFVAQWREERALQARADSELVKVLAELRDAIARNGCRLGPPGSGRGGAAA